MGGLAQRHVPTMAFVLGLVFAAVGALLIIIGGIALPAASVVVRQMASVTAAQQADVDTLARFGPFLLGFGVAHVIAGFGLLFGQAWGRPLAATMSVAMTGLALAAIVVVANKVTVFVDWTSPSALGWATGAVGALAVAALVYVVAAIAVVASPASSASAPVSPGWWAGEADHTVPGPA